MQAKSMSLAVSLVLILTGLLALIPSGASAAAKFIFSCGDRHLAGSRLRICPAPRG